MDLTGELVRLRAPRAEDAGRLAAITADPVVARFAGPPLLLPQTEAQTRDWLLARAPDRYRWAIERLEGGELLGDCSLNRLDWRHRHCWFGILLGPPGVWGHGYGTEATRLVTRFGLRDLGLEKVYLGVFEGNERARDVYERCGYGLEATLPRDHLLEGRLVTTFVMAAHRDHPLYA